MAKITSPKELNKRKNLGENPSGSERDSFNEHVKREAEFKRYPKPEKEQNRFPKSN